MMDWSLAGSRHAETLFLMRLHMDSDIQVFFPASPSFSFGIYLRRAVKSLYSLIGVVGVRKGSHVHLPRYSAFSFRSCSRPRFPLRSHSLICIENHLFIVGKGPILNKELGFIFRYDCCVYSYVSVLYNKS